MPRAEYERLLDGAGDGWFAIEELARWDPSEGAYTELVPGGASPDGACLFRRDTIARLWPVRRESDRIATAACLGRAAPRLLGRLAEFFGDPIREPHILTDSVPECDAVNLDLSIAALVARDATRHEVIGFSLDNFTRCPTLSLAVTDRRDANPVRIGPPEWKRRAVSAYESRNCVERGVHLIDMPRGKVAIAVTGKDAMSIEEKFCCEVLTLEHGLASSVLDELRRGIVEHNTYRGKVVF